MSDFRTIQERPARSRALLLYMIAAAGLPLSSVIAALLLPAFGGLSLYTKLLVSDCLYYIPFIIIPILIVSKRNPGVYTCTRNEGLSFGRILLLFPLAFLMFVLCNGISVLWAIPFQGIGLNIYAGSIPSPQNVQDLMMYVISAAAIPAVCEEYLFRSVLLNSFEKNGTRRAILLTSMMFAFLHGNVIGMPAEFFAGLIIACIAVSCNSIYAGMILHTVYNTIVAVVAYLGPDSRADSLVESLGGLSGVISVIFQTALFGAAIFFLLRGLFRHTRTDGQVFVQNRKSEKLSRIEIFCIAVAGLAIILLYVLDVLAML